MKSAVAWIALGIWVVVWIIVWSKTDATWALLLGIIPAAFGFWLMEQMDPKPKRYWRNIDPPGPPR